MKMANQEDENITVSKIYETLKSGPFLRNLYWDVLSDIKEKSTFKQMKETTEKLLNKKTEALTNLSESEADTLQRKKIVTEICSLTYTVDTVFSKIMFIKLQKEFKSQIIDSIKDLRKEKKINDSVWSKLAQDPVMRSLAESSAGKSNVSQQKPVAETSSRPVRNKRHRMTPNEIAIKNYEIRSEIHKDLKAINSEEKKKETYHKKLRPKNHVTPEIQTETMPKSILKKKQNDEKQTASIRHRRSIEVKPGENSFFENTEEVKITPEGKVESDEEGSDTDSIISVGHVSTASVSSVHTSDLSSFDDEISLSSEDEQDGVKRRISLKELKQVCNGKLPEKLDSSILKDLSEVSKESSKKSPVAKSKQQSEEISKRKPIENNKSNKNKAEQTSKRKTAENNKKQIEESSKRITIESDKQQVEESSKRKTNENSISQIESPKKLSVKTNESQIEESSKMKTVGNNKLQIEGGSKTNSIAINKQPVQECPKKSVNGNSKKLVKSFQDQLDSADSATESKLDSSKTLLKRIRKPNSKYSSDNILCTITKVKERKKQTVVDNEKHTSHNAQPNKKRSRKDSSDSNEEVPPKNFKILPFPEINTKPTINPPNRRTSLEIFKPQFPMRSLTSRMTDPVTLFST